ncbi:MAG TPA: DUF1465 family protein [Patescibacteria group bacterium]|nr:DUF1465 family protein [Patescibacteria group bacterium]
MIETPTLDAAVSETIGLMEDTRDYVMRTNAYAPEHFADPMQRLAAIRESSRLTGQLTSILSWLLWQKATLAGEISRSEMALHTVELMEAAPQPAANDLGCAVADLPDGLSELIAKTDRLFTRITHM